MKSISKIASQETKNFKTRLRADKTSHVVYKKDDGELYDFIREMHDGILPNDWLFKTIRDLLESLADTDAETPDEARDYLLNNIEPDIYNVDLYEWQQNFGDHWTEEARENGLIGDNMTVIEQIQAGQFFHIENIAHALIDALNTIQKDSD